MIKRHRGAKDEIIIYRLFLFFPGFSNVIHLKAVKGLGTSQRPGLQSKIVFVCNKRANKPLEPLRRYLNSQGFQIKAYGEREKEFSFFFCVTRIEGCRI